MSAAACGVDIKDIYINVLESSLRELGKNWETGEIDVAEEHYFTAATIQIMSQLYQYLKPAGKRGTSFVGVTAPGEQHDIGMRMVADLLELDGWTAYNLGIDLPLTNLLSALKLFNADLLGLSATIERNVNNLKFIVESVRREPELAAVKILVGGLPFVQDPELWERIGADGFAANAADVAEIAATLVPPALSFPGAVREA
jgi:methanogenic corrinoid protein MtbC1